ncbi:MAG: hypothetical protein ACREIQ_00960 [Nitrospiria bacterium]
MINWLRNSLLDQAAKRFSNAVRDVGQFVAEVHLVTDHVKSWRKQIRRIDEAKLADIVAAVEGLRGELRGLASEMDVYEGKLEEAKALGWQAVDQLATGEHLLTEENRALLLAGDVAGVYQALATIEPEMFREAVRRLKANDPDRAAMLFQNFKGELGVK